jgi:carbon monoxide dehydrogenase subunit G
MRWEGDIVVPGRPEDVIAAFADVERMAQYLPGASIEGRGEDGSYLGAITVTFGPKRLVFRGKMTSETDFAAKSGALQGQGSSDQRAARFKVRVTYALHDLSVGTSPPSTRVNIVSVAELQGVLEDFARTGGPAVAKVILDEFAGRFTAGMAASLSPTAETTAPAPAEALSGPALMLRASQVMIAQAFARLRVLLGFR